MNPKREAELAVIEIVRRHTHQGPMAITYHAGQDPERDCLLCRALVKAGALTLNQIGASTRAAIEIEMVVGGYVECVLCGEPERVEDKYGTTGKVVCMSCADAIVFEQNVRRSRVVKVEGS